MSSKVNKTNTCGVEHWTEESCGERENLQGSSVDKYKKTAGAILHIFFEDFKILLSSNPSPHILHILRSNRKDCSCSDMKKLYTYKHTYIYICKYIPNL